MENKYLMILTKSHFINANLSHLKMRVRIPPPPQIYQITRVKDAETLNNASFGKVKILVRRV